MKIPLCIILFSVLLGMVSAIFTDSLKQALICDTISWTMFVIGFLVCKSIPINITLKSNGPDITLIQCPDNVIIHLEEIP